MKVFHIYHVLKFNILLNWKKVRTIIDMFSSTSNFEAITVKPRMGFDLQV